MDGRRAAGRVVTVSLWRERIETGDNGLFETWAPGRLHAEVTVSVPVWVARVLCWWQRR